MMDKSKRRSGFLPRLLLVGFGIFLAAVVAEIGLRAAEAIQLRRARVLVEEGDPSKFWMTYDADIGYRLTPNFGRYNADGLKDHPVEPKNGRFRLLFLGDSIIYDDIGLDDTLVAYLRAELDKDRTLAPVETLNAGIPGYTNWQELMFLKKYGLKFEPDLVGVEFCLNDLPKILQQFHVENGRIIPAPWFTVEEAKASSRGWLIRLGRKSYLLMWLRYHLRFAAWATELARSGGYTFEYNPDVNQAWKDNGWPAIENQLAEMDALGRQHSFRVFVVSFPLAEQYRSDYLARDREYVLKPQRKLKEVCARLGIPFYDLYPQLETARFTDGMHLDRSGRQLTGRKIAEWLKTQGLLPQTPPAGPR